MNKYLFVPLLLGVLVYSEGCRRQNPSRSSGAAATPSSTPDTTLTARPAPERPSDSVKLTSPAGPASANVSQVDFRYLTTRSRISFKSPAQELDNAAVTIRMRKDSLIWVSVSKLGIEAARLLITPDSVRVMDKIHREYSAVDFPTLSRRFNFNLTFQLLQALVVGNLPQPSLVVQEQKSEDGYQLLRQTDGGLVIENYIGEDNRKLKKLVLNQQSTKNTLRLNYDDFTAVEAFLFPFTSQVTLDYQAPANGQQQQTVLTIRHTKVDLSNSSPGFPFTLPATYQRRP